MSDETLLNEVINACDIDRDVARAAVLKALRASGCVSVTPTCADVKRALTELRRVLEETVAPARAYEATERIDMLLATLPERPTVPLSLAEITRRLRENNQRLSSRDFDGELADVEAEMVSRKRRSMLPPSR